MLKKCIVEFRHISGRHIGLVLTGCGILRRWLGHSTLKGGAIEGSTEARIRGVALLLGEGSVTGSLGLAG